MIYQLCYSSCASQPAPLILDDLRNILSEAYDYNHHYAITGALYFADGHFFQWLEGKKMSWKY